MTQYNEGYDEKNVHVVIMRSLTANEYTAYKVSTSQAGNSGTPDNGFAYWPNPLQLTMYGLGNSVFYTGASCSGTAHVRYSAGGTDANNDTKMSAGYLGLMSMPNLYLKDGAGQYEVKLKIGGTTGTSTAPSWRDGTGACAALGPAAPSSSYREVEIRTPTFPASLGTSWTIDL